MYSGFRAKIPWKIGRKKPGSDRDDCGWLCPDESLDRWHFGLHRAGRDETLETIDTGAAFQHVLTDLDVAIAESKTEVVFETLPSLRFVKTSSSKSCEI